MHMKVTELTWRKEDEDKTKPDVWAVPEVTVYALASGHAGLQQRLLSRL